MTGLHCQDLTIGYPPDKTLIENAEMTLLPGNFIGLVGQNGIGKSTLIRTMCGLQQPLKGNIYLNGVSISEISQNQMAKTLSVVLTGKPETLNLSVLELIALGRHPHTGWLGILSDSDKKIIEQAITQMEINYIATKKLFELSDGQLQKVMIARALAQDTDYIILDEPTSHLDLKNKIEVLELLKKISNSGKGILISTHEIQLASHMCSTFWCVDFGKPLISDSPKRMIKKGVIHNYLHLPQELKLH